MRVGLVHSLSWIGLAALTTPWLRTTVNNVPEMLDARLWRSGTADYEIWVGYHHMFWGSNGVHSSMSHFWETVEDCDLQEFGFRGAALMWNNGQDIPDNIHERALHVVLDEGADNMRDYHGDKQFRFEPLWWSREEYKDVVLGIWFLEAIGGNGAALMRTLDI
ncbi:hypothetical protein TIFTF001_016397 [Ficus carica]|uniref:Uncharacterized protein n=1 Tax=Ficus carica TaxID=3494 RepID=A0AA88A684_FICCA|nr:hypothetical protein TIFTF001_016397 [Ficus carica]